MFAKQEKSSNATPHDNCNGCIAQDMQLRFITNDTYLCSAYVAITAYIVSTTITRIEIKP
jgi:hypothetical protein